jgi:carboxy-terminal domain RNA polymerase II polypeptide A small phosphatase
MRWHQTSQLLVAMAGVPQHRRMEATALSSPSGGRPRPRYPLKSLNTNTVKQYHDVHRAETMVHSSFTPIENADFVISVDVDGTLMHVYIIKRPWLDFFLQQVAAVFEVVVFTASLRKYADAVIDHVDPYGAVSARLYRESCVLHQGAYVKDLSRMGRPLEKMVLVDNSPLSYAFQPANGLPSSTFLDNCSDVGLLDILEILLRVRGSADVRTVLPEACSICQYRISPDPNSGLEEV